MVALPAALQEFLNSAIGEGWQQILLAGLVAYLVAAVIVFRFPSPFAARVGGKLGANKRPAEMAEEPFPDPSRRATSPSRS